MPQPHATILTSQSQPSYHGSYNIPSSNSTQPASIFPPPVASGGTLVDVGRGGGSASESGHPSSATATNFSNPSSSAPRNPAFYYHYNKGTGASRSDATGGLRNTKGLNLNSRDQQRADETLSGAPQDTQAGSADAPASLPFFPPGTLPRSSSLLPPPRTFVIAQAGVLRVDAEQEPSSFLEPLTPRRPPTSHSRASSIEAVSDSFRNLNRWSASTTSSRASTTRDRERGTDDLQHQQQQSPQRPTTKDRNNFSRRMSVDSVALAQTTDPTQPIHQSPRKLSKRPPSDGSVTASPQQRATSSARSRSRQNSPPHKIVAPPNLPPIVSLPSLELPSRSESPPTSLYRPSPSPGAGVTPNSVLSNQGKDYFWNELAETSSNNKLTAGIRGNNPALLPAASIDRDQDREKDKDQDAMPDRKGHTRNRSSAAKGSPDSAKNRDRGKQPSQKAMLSKALSKANTAVQLDNAQNYEGARQSYIEACELLQQVLARTAGEDDKKKLEAIRRTYTSRIEELDGMVPVQTQSSKALYSRPESLAYNGVQGRPAERELMESAVMETATATHIGSSPSRNMASHQTAWPPAMDDGRYGSTTNLSANDQTQLSLQSSFSKSPMRKNFEGSLNIPRPDQEQLLPAPLSPRRTLSPAQPASPEAVVRQDFSMPTDRLAAPDTGRGHSRNPSNESVSFFLDPISESGGSASSSVHSRTSSFGVRRKHIRAVSGDTEAEFDAALDAAVEAAYDDGYEPMDSAETTYNDENDVVANAMHKVELAKERVRQSEREAAIEMARDKERKRQLQNSQDPQTLNAGFYDCNDSDEEEERMIEEMTKGYMDDFTYGSQSQSQSRVPRSSDSSGVTQRTWHSSVGSNPPTGTTVLSTVTETPVYLSKTPPSLPPPPQALPQVPPQPPGVRSRRLSGQNPKQLKIETSRIGPPPTVPASAIERKPGSYIAQQRQALSATSTRPGPFSVRQPGSPGRGINPAPAVAPPSPPHHPTLAEEPEDQSPTSTRPPLRKNQSTSSLKSLKNRQQSISNVDNDLSPNTPLSQTLTNNSRQPAVPALPTPLASSFRDKLGSGFGGLYLFDDLQLPSPNSPSSIDPTDPYAPMPLEPCPSDVMLRPFWLMRALYQTLAHPRGGYITNRLFVPREVWKVKGVKLRSLEDKMAQCDLLTAALLKLARVDSNDADAVLEEMQSFENVLEQVQITLTRKLGNEVGTQGLGRDESDPAPQVLRNASVSGKGGAFSWRRLRNKGSAVNLSTAYGGKSSSGGSGGATSADLLGSERTGSLTSLPMVAHPSSRPAKRDVKSVNFDGPFANYTASLARLFDAAQTVDQIARQVEDPGLRHADKTQVGLELCTRHAAEFFGFYICRFVLADLGLLLDKFVKRGSEWVLG